MESVEKTLLFCGKTLHILQVFCKFSVSFLWKTLLKWSLNHWEIKFTAVHTIDISVHLMYNCSEEVEKWGREWNICIVEPYRREYTIGWALLLNWQALLALYCSCSMQGLSELYLYARMGL